MSDITDGTTPTRSPGDHTAVAYLSDLPRPAPPRDAFRGVEGVLLDRQDVMVEAAQRGEAMTRAAMSLTTTAQASIVVDDITTTTRALATDAARDARRFAQLENDLPDLIRDLARNVENRALGAPTDGGPDITILKRLGGHVADLDDNTLRLETTALRVDQLAHALGAAGQNFDRVGLHPDDTMSPAAMISHAAWQGQITLDNARTDLGQALDSRAVMSSAAARVTNAYMLHAAVAERPGQDPQHVLDSARRFAATALPIADRVEASSATRATTGARTTSSPVAPPTDLTATSRATSSPSTTASTDRATATGGTDHEARDAVALSRLGRPANTGPSATPAHTAPARDTTPTGFIDRMRSTLGRTR